MILSLNNNNTTEKKILQNDHCHFKSTKTIFNFRSERKISKEEFNRLQRNYTNYAYECEDGQKGMTRADFIKNLPGARDVSKYKRCKNLTSKDEDTTVKLIIDQKRLLHSFIKFSGSFEKSHFYNF